MQLSRALYKMFRRIYLHGLLSEKTTISRLQCIRFFHGTSSNESDDEQKKSAKSNDSNTSSNHCTSSDPEIPPPPTNCCMSGCANCVWIQYAETLSSKLRDGSDMAREIIMKEVQDSNIRSFLEMELRMLKSKSEK